MFVTGNFKILLRFLGALVITVTQAQDQSIDEKGIILHLNKTKYASGEHIWYSSYLIDQESKSLLLELDYIYLNLLDSQGQIIENRVTLSKNGSGSGSIFLKPEIESGNYFIQAYTLNMNHSTYDRSTIYPISIINFGSGLMPSNSSETSNIQIDLSPESGLFLENVFNTCGVSIRDPFNKPIKVDSLIVLDQNGHMKQSVPINQEGLGKFSFIPNKNSKLTATAYYLGKTTSVDIIKAEETGFILSATTNHPKKELALAIATNQQTLLKGISEKLTLRIHQNQNANTIKVPITLTNYKKYLIIPYADLPEGVILLSLVDDKTNVLASRSVFILKNNSNTPPQITYAKRENDSITLRLQTFINLKNGFKPSFSLSVLPEKSIAGAGHYDINPNSLYKSIFQAESIALKQNSIVPKDKLYDIDLRLLTDIKNVNDHKLDESKINSTRLSSLKGYVNLFDAKNDSLSVLLYSAENSLFETTLLGKEGKFEFQEIPLKKNSKITLTLLDKKGKPIYANFFYTLQPTQKNYRFSYKPSEELKRELKLESIEGMDLGTTNQIELEEVVVTEERLKYAQFLGEFNGRKIDSTLIGLNTLGNYIRNMGYRQRFESPMHPDPKRAASVQLYRECAGLFGPIIVYPSISLNGRFSNYAMDYEQTRMENIDEVYYLKRERCDGGLFVVFMKEVYLNRPLAESDKNSKQFTITNGYDAPSSFIRPPYLAMNSKAFENFGVVAWFPHLIPDENGTITFKVPDDGQRQLKLQLIGIAANGMLFKDTLLCRVEN